MIDIIIPAYNSHSTIFNTLSSIAVQHFKFPYKVTIVNDGGEGYSELVEIFGKRMDIQVIETQNNGPAVARQIGLESTSNPFVIFIDADDIFINALSFQLLYDRISSDPEIACANSRFITELKDGSLDHFGVKEFIWLFGNIYRRSFIEKNNIRFPKFSANEDLLFNLEITIKCAQTGSKVVYMDEHTYLWKFNKNSITRRDDMEYSFFDSSYHIIRGKTDLFSKFEISEIAPYIVEAVWDFYFFWEESISGRKYNSDYHNNLMQAIKEYYLRYKELLDSVRDEDWKFLNKKKKEAMNYLNRMTFMDFIAIMKRQQG